MTSISDQPRVRHAIATSSDGAVPKAKLEHGAKQTLDLLFFLTGLIFDYIAFKTAVEGFLANPRRTTIKPDTGIMDLAAHARE